MPEKCLCVFLFPSPVQIPTHLQHQFQFVFVDIFCCTNILLSLGFDVGMIWMGDTLLSAILSYPHMDPRIRFFNKEFSKLNESISSARFMVWDFLCYWYHVKQICQSQISLSRHSNPKCPTPLALYPLTIFTLKSWKLNLKHCSPSSTY